MKKYILPIIIIAILSACAANKKNKSTEEIVSATSEVSKTMPQSVYDFPLVSIDGKKFSLKDYKGKKILLVNTASKCGYTPQYEALEALSKKYNDKLVVVGVPANNFMGQEPGTNEDIASFCKKNYGVTFPLTEKMSVVGDNAAPLFKFLLNKELNGGLETAIKWNFTKFLVDENGKLIANFPSKVKPMDAEIIDKL
jgi:glutathione peroxidase